MHPIQQQGRRIPSLSSLRTLSTCCILVSGFLTEIVQHIHSLRASGVRSSQAASASASAVIASSRSSGSSCTTPPDTSLEVIVIKSMLLLLARGSRKSRYALPACDAQVGPAAPFVRELPSTTAAGGNSQPTPGSGTPSAGHPRPRLRTLRPPAPRGC